MENRHRRNVETVARIICCPMIAQAPNPAVASAIPAIPGAKVPSMIRSSRLRKFMSRVEEGACVVPSAVTTNVTDNAAKRGCTSGSP